MDVAKFKERVEAGEQLQLIESVVMLATGTPELAKIDNKSKDAILTELSVAYRQGVKMALELVVEETKASNIEPSAN